MKTTIPAMRAAVEDGCLVIRIPIRYVLENVNGPPQEAILDTLTVREREVLGRLLTGETHKETAAQLACSRRAVSGHAWEIYKKLQVHTRQELLLKFRKPGG
jgi:DNA-binding NarL/FixJ family response regulator